MRNVLAILLAATALAIAAERPRTLPDQFLFGASTYPELQTREEWNRMLDQFQKAHFKVVRVSESSWGNLETAPGQHNFGWLKAYLDDVHKRGMKAVLGTSSYIAPQWLAAKNPEILVQPQPGQMIHPMARKAACLNHPLYRQALRRYILALGRAFKDHPAVIGWQLDNEIEFIVGRPCHNPACERAWHDWLKKAYGSAAEFNRRLKLVSWGMQVDSFDDVPQPRGTVEGAVGRVALPALALANLHFRRDAILDFFADQTAALREAGVKHWITTDWNTVWTALADDPKASQSLDVASLNFYQPSGDSVEFWNSLAWHLDMHRSAHGLGHFLVTETRVGVAGDTVMWDPFPTRDQFRMWMLQPAAYGAFGLMYWTGNRWTGGHWPHWGGVLDWTGQPELDFDWLVELGQLFDKWGSTMLRNPVKASAAVITDFDQRAALQAYAHVPSSNQVLPQAFDALHRLAIGADSINADQASKPGALSRYSLVVIPAATALDNDRLPAALKAYVENGGRVVVTPFTAYQNWDGVFRSDGFGANLADLTGALARTARRMGTSEDGSGAAVAGDRGRGAGPRRTDQHVAWLGGSSPVGIDGYCEILDVRPDAEVIGRFQSDEPLLDGKPAAVRRKLGKGEAVKMAFWPKDDSVLRLFRDLAGANGNLLAEAPPQGFQAVPRSDGSLFVINTTPRAGTVRLARDASDRISGRSVQREIQMKPYEVLWLE
jgi:beta-galactosidase